MQPLLLVCTESTTNRNPAMAAKSLVLLASVATSLAKIHDVQVGASGLAFTPDTVHAAIHDTINFHFHPMKHSVAQSLYSNPCQPFNGSIDSQSLFSGFVPVQSGQAKQMFSVMVNNTDPMWLYCSAGAHCQEGMAMVVNPLDGGSETLEGYLDAAKNAETMSPTTVYGGMLVDTGAANDSSSLNSTATASKQPTLHSGGGVASETATSAPTHTGGATKAAQGLIVLAAGALTSCFWCMI